MKTVAILLLCLVVMSEANPRYELVHKVYKLYKAMKEQEHEEYLAENTPVSPEPFSMWPFPEHATKEPSSEPEGNPWKKMVDWAYAEAESEAEPESDPEAEYKHVAWFFLAVTFMVISVILAITTAVYCTKYKSSGMKM